MERVITETAFYDFLDKVCKEVPSTMHTVDERHLWSSYEQAGAAISNRGIKYPLIALGSIQGGLSSHGDSNYDIKNPSFTVLKPSKKEDFDEHRVIRDECLEIGMDILERFNQYRHSYQFLQRFNLNTVRYSQATGKHESHIGYIFQIEIGSPRQIKNVL
jgi:hypothetical protein